jgi:hypothetical protein
MQYRTLDAYQQAINQEELENTKGAIRIHIWRNRQHNDQNRSKMITLKNKLIRSLLTKLVTFRVI